MNLARVPREPAHAPERHTPRGDGELTENRAGFLRRVRLRMRIAWFAATAQKYAPYLGLAMLAVVAADWITRFDSGLLVAAGLTGVFLLLLAVRALTVKISAWDASRAAERGSPSAITTTA